MYDTPHVITIIYLFNITRLAQQNYVYFFQKITHPRDISKHSPATGTVIRNPYKISISNSNIDFFGIN